jgi:hypothetical protein
MKRHSTPRFRLARFHPAARIPALLTGLALAGCAGLQAQSPEGAARKENVHAVTVSNRLITFNAGQPQRILAQKPLQGLQAGEQVLGIDYRVARGELYALGSSGRLYRIDTASGTAAAVGGPFAVPLAGTEFGFDFNPVADRIRVVGNTGQNLRLHPDTGAVVDSDQAAPGVQLDGALSYAPGDVHAGQKPGLVAAAYTYNKQDEKLTTNFAIDAVHGTLVTQGSREGKSPVVSPNSGQLFTVGALGIGAVTRTAFDIADVSGAAFVAASRGGAASSSWYEINLDNGKASLIGTIGGGEPVVGIAVEP